MNVLFVTAEAYPFKKVGGLGDVSYALPKALNSLGNRENIIMPKYRCEKKYKKRLKFLSRFKTFIGWKTVECTLWVSKFDNITYYFVDNPFYFYRDSVYGYEDDNERYIFFCKAVLESLKYINDFKVDIIHCNDWHTSLIIPLKDIYYSNNSYYKNIKTVFTIHNLCYQGIYNKNDTFWMLGIDDKKYYTEDKFKYGNGVSFIKWGIAEADKIVAVSSQYSKEIRTIQYGCGLEDVLERRQSDLLGIENGIDNDIFNPELDDIIYSKYSVNNIENKSINKFKFKEEFYLKSGDMPLIGIVSRLVDQKGIDLIELALENIIHMGFQVAVLGSGNKEYEISLKSIEKKHRDNLKVFIKYDEALSHKIYAASDFFLMPSKFEPCGLSQLIAMKYGSIPIVRRVGGLVDTVKDFDYSSLNGNGITFFNYYVEELMLTVERAKKMYNNRYIKDKAVKNCMMYDSTWRKSALKYNEIYKELGKIVREI